MINISFAQVGHVLKLVGGEDAYVLRANNKIMLSTETDLMEHDEVHAETSHVVLQLYPSSQLSVPRGSVVKLTQNLVEETDGKGKGSSIIDLVKGFIRLQVNKVEDVEVEHSVKANNVTFGVRGTEFEVELTDDDVDLDVFEGEVEVSSPEVMTFVPYFVKKGEGFRFNRRKPAFARRKLAARMKETGFVPREQVKARWKERKERVIRRRGERKERVEGMKERREDLREKREGMKGNRQERRETRSERRDERRERRKR